MSDSTSFQPDVDDAAALRRRLLAWFRREARALPWRRRRTLYGIWIAEVMLQQTTVAAVVPYWERFLARYPDVTTLAASSEEEVLALWSGLGYYRRARSLLAAAREIADCRQGRLPTDRAGWSDLPGIGPYASGAIASMGLGEAVPAVDANVRRVLARWAAATPDAAAALRGRPLEGLAAALVPTRSPGIWNEAVMELGALICTPRSPRCGACPVRTDCRAGRAGTADQVPPVQPRPAPTPVQAGMLVVRHGPDVLLLPPGAPCATGVEDGGDPLREDLSGLHRGLWGLPTTPWYAADTAGFDVAAGAAWSDWLAAAGAGSAPVAAGERLAHAITRWRLDIRVHDVRLSAPDARSLARASDGRWWPPERDLPVSRLVRKILAPREPNRYGG